MYPVCGSAANYVYNSNSSANTQTLPFVAGLVRVYVPTTCFVQFATASASINGTTPGTQKDPGTYLMSASGCTMFAAAGQTTDQFTVNIVSLASVA